MSFTWVPFYREVAERVLEYEDRQSDLVAILCEMKAAGLPTISFVEELPNNVVLPFAEIDPFTFMSIFSSADIEDSKKKCLWLKNQWKFQSTTIEDFNGRVSAEAHNPEFCDLGEEDWELESNRSLWQLARQAFTGNIENIDAEIFNHCINDCSSSIEKITTGLSWINPAEFLSAISFVSSFVNSQKGSSKAEESDISSLSGYRNFLENARRVNLDFVALSHDARLAKFGRKINVEIPFETPKGKAQIHQMTQPTKYPLNQILYGPPGTGKTYSTIQRAVEIIDDKILPHKEAKKRFDELRKNGQIEFVTFHQSFSYEEFIEGLRPILDGDGTARYEIRYGVLKTLALRATGMSLEKKAVNRSTFESVWAQLAEKTEEANWKMNGISKEGQYEVEINGKKINAINLSGEKNISYQLNRSLIEKAWQGLLDRSEEEVRSKQVYEIIQVGTHPAVVAAFVRELKRIEKEKPSQISSTSLEKSSEAAQSFLNNSQDYRANFVNAPRYVLIVDEINRGNISKILGELITLLELDKRIGADNELRVQLPVSGEHFALPPNLYLLGTMNTADKSLALLDIALRRRFDFIEMPPQSKLFPDFARDVLIQLNLRLEAALDREHRIGHAYFIGCNKTEFNDIFRNKIIPLLQEFFYNDWETLRAVLGESGDKNGAFVVKLKAPDGMKVKTKWRWWFDVDGVEDFDFLAALRDNYKVNADDES